MASEAPTYDLMLMLSTEAPEEQRTKVLSEVETTISQAGGSIERNDDWGRRPMAYQIRHQPEAEYHLLQFHAPGELISELSHTLRITDGVLRSRIIKVRPGTPPAPASAPPVVASAVTSSSPAAAASDGAAVASEAPAAPAAEETAPAAAQPEPEAEAAEPAPAPADHSADADQ
jgi:small subunit ribosomal protein S6